METRAHYILVGLFTLASAAAVLLFTLWMTGAGADREVDLYDVMFSEPVSGLTVGSPVQYSGIRIGEVTELTLNPVDPRIVRARVQVSSYVPVKVDTGARLTLLNITGASAIELTGGTPDSANLTASGGIAVIEATPSSLTQLRVTSEELIVSASTLLDRANRLLSDDNNQRITRVLDNVEEVTGGMSEQQAMLQDGLTQLAQAGRSLNELLDQVSQQMTQYEEPILQGVATTISDLQQLSQQLNVMVADNAPALSSGMQGFADLAPAMTELREILNTIDVLTRRISDDPTNFILGNDNIREYQP
jgi:phospholipid/cholesterol/gamma-HCH transport system substrate-binding protein